MKNLIIFSFTAFLSHAAFAQQSAATPIAPAAEKKACCAAGSEKAGKSCSAPAGAKVGASCSNGTAEANAAPTTTITQMSGTVKQASTTTQTAQFQVWGNCGMCKKTIEKAAKGVAGVETAEWNVDTHQFNLTFDPAKTGVDKVHQAIAASGYDTDTVRGNDLAYNDLPGCCQYERRKQ